MIIKIPEAVEKILTILNENGYEAYAVGGCVRDSILGRIPNDWDITTSAKPEQVKELFHKTVDTGLQHGTVTVLWHGEGYEVTTYRIDGEYEDGRHPKEVIFTGNLEEDLRRRDFTINAMAYHPQEGLVDLFGGMEDLEQKIIRCVGVPEERFDEDVLRVFRAVRFSAQLGFSIEEETKKAICSLVSRLHLVSAERIQVELVKLLISPHPEYIRIAYETGITAQILPEFDAMMHTEQENPHHCYTVGEHTLKVLQNIPPQKGLRLAALLHDVGKPVTKTTENGVDHFYRHDSVGADMAKKILRRMKFDNATIQQVYKLVLFHDMQILAGEKYVRRALYKTGVDTFAQILELRYADCMAQSSYKREEKLQNLQEIGSLYEKIKKEQQCVSMKQLAVTGKDLIEAGVEPGPHMGKQLESLLQWVIEHPEDNQKEVLLSRIEIEKKG